VSITTCNKCGTHIANLNPGIYLQRVNPRGVPGVVECRPKCFHSTGTQEEALLAALSANEISEDQNE
jgi:hypothetical protein